MTVIEGVFCPGRARLTGVKLWAVTSLRTLRRETGRRRI